MCNIHPVSTGNAFFTSSQRIFSKMNHLTGSNTHLGETTEIKQNSTIVQKCMKNETKRQSHFYKKKTNLCIVFDNAYFPCMFDKFLYEFQFFKNLIPL